MIRTCVVTSDGNYAGDISLDGKMYQTCRIKKGQEGFILGGGRFDQLQRKWFKFVVARSEPTPGNRGWVLENHLTIGQVATKTKVLFKECNISGLIEFGNTGSRLQKTVFALFGTLGAEKSDLMTDLGVRVVIDTFDITEPANVKQIMQHIWKGKSKPRTNSQSRR